MLFFVLLPVVVRGRPNLNRPVLQSRPPEPLDPDQVHAEAESFRSDKKLFRGRWDGACKTGHDA